MMEQNERVYLIQLHNMQHIIVTIVLCLSIVCCSFNMSFFVYAEGIHSVTVTLSKYEQLLEDSSERAGGVVLNVWKLDKSTMNEDDKPQWIKKLGSKSDIILSKEYGTPIISGKSDIKGIITVSGLSEGVYYFREKITGIHNMDLTPFVFVVPDNGTKVVMKIYTPSGGSSGGSSGGGSGDLSSPIDSIELIDPITPPNPPGQPEDTPDIENPKGNVKFMVIADDSEKTPLKGAKFKVMIKSGNVFVPVMRNGKDYILESDENGFFEATDLPYGEYYLWQTKPPVGYLPLTEPIVFEVNKSKKEDKILVIKHKVDSSVKIKIPKTGDMIFFIMMISGIILFSVGSYFVRKNESE